jgi:hypothetical protein
MAAFANMPKVPKGAVILEKDFPDYIVSILRMRKGKENAILLDFLIEVLQQSSGYLKETLERKIRSLPKKGDIHRELNSIIAFVYEFRKQLFPDIKDTDHHLSTILYNMLNPTNLLAKRLSQLKYTRKQRKEKKQTRKNRKF